jgi:tripartite-type tricarboxylate transporter receptor subunit TctC
LNLPSHHSITSSAATSSLSGTVRPSANAALAHPKSKARLVDLVVEPMPLTSAGFAKFISDETDKWAKVIKSAGIKPE